MAKTRRTKGAAPGAPRPKIEPRKQPFLKRRHVRVTALVVVLALALWGGLTLWGHASRANALKKYDTALFEAQRTFQAGIEGDNPQSITQLPRSFAQKKTTAAAFRRAATAWENDFKSARDKVRALKPPDELTEANSVIGEAIDQYVGLARLYGVAAQGRLLAASEPTKALQKKGEDQVQLLLTHLNELRSRADALLAIGKGKIEALKHSWGVSERTPAPAPVGT